MRRSPVNAWDAVCVFVTLAGCALALWHPPLDFLDGPYADGSYPLVQRAITGATNDVPFAVGSLFVIAVLLVAIGIWIRPFRSGRDARGWLRAILRTVALAAFLYVWFLVAWGWNYLRPPLSATMGFTPPDLSSAQLERLEVHIASALDAEAVPAHALHARAADETPALDAAEAQTLRIIGIDHPVTRTNPKYWLMDPYFDAVGISGMFFPFTFETFVASDNLWFEYPFTLEHEWGHVAGVARESDANFIAAVSTLDSSDAVLRYSGLLEVYGAMPRGPADRLLSRLVLSDYQAIRARDEHRINPFVSHVAWNAYDRYLKAQHVRSGVVNYTEYIRLLLGTRAGRNALSAATGKSFP